MSMILRLTRLQSLKKGLQLLTAKEEVVRNTTCRFVSNSSSNKTSTSNIGDEAKPYLTKKAWVSYGFSEDDKILDRHSMHQTMFVVVSICLVFGAFVIAYIPDPTYRDWAQREAFLQLRYREEHDLPLIDPNLIDPAKINLPSDEELGDTEIII